MKKILILTDFSDTSQKAAEYALQLYEGIACSFTVLNCYGGFPTVMNEAGRIVDQKAQARIDNYVRELRARDFHTWFSFHGMAVGGSLGVAVTALYEKDPFDLVVAGASGTGNNVRLGSVATDLLRAARYPVLVVPASVSIKPILSIVAATDYQKLRSAEAYETVRELMEHGGRTLALLHVMLPGSSGAEVDRPGKALLTTYFRKYNPPHISEKNDSVVEGIEAFLTTHETDLLVMLSQHQGFWDVVLNRSTSRILAYEARVPLMVLTEHVSEPSDALPAIDWNVIL